MCMHDLSRINEDFNCGYHGVENIGMMRGNTHGKKDKRVRDLATQAH